MLGQSVYLFGAKVFGYGLRILLPVFLVRVLPKADIGTYSQFFLLEILIKNFFQMGMNQSQYYFIPRAPRNAGGYLINTIVLNLAFFTVGYTLVGLWRIPLATQLGMPVLRNFFWILVAYSFLMMGTVIFSTYMQARNLFLQSARYEIFLQVLASLATLAAAYFTRDLKMVFLSLVAARALGAACGAAWVHFRMQGFRSEQYFFFKWEQMKYGFPLGVVGLLWMLLMQMNQLAVSRFYDLETFAVYAQGLKQIPVLQLYSQSIAAVALVKFAQLEKEGDWEGLKKLWNRLLASVYGLGVPITIVLILAARPLIILMFTGDYIGAVPIFRINTIAMLYLLLNPTLVLRALDRNDITVKVYAVLVVLMPGVYVLMNHWFGLLGIISAHAVGLILARGVSHFALNRLVPVHLPYIPPAVEVKRFYQDVYHRSRARTLELLRSGSGKRE